MPYHTSSRTIGPHDRRLGGNIPDSNFKNGKGRAVFFKNIHAFIKKTCFM